MKAWRFWSLVALTVVPVAVLVALGGWTLWKSGLLLWTWWILPLCWGLSYLLAQHSRRESIPLQAGIHWTSRDQEAIHLIEARSRKIAELNTEQLTDPRFYLDSAIELAVNIAQHYEPRAVDPIGSLRVPEVLAAAHLAIEDLEDWVRETVPASHLLTIRQWKKLSNAPDWITTAQNVAWVISTVVNPANILRYVASKFTMDPLSKFVQTNLLAAFYAAYIRQVGFYLIEMNSGRLRGGSERYRELIAELQRETKPTEPRSPADKVEEVTLAVMGQVKAGKSSVINTLLGDRQAKTDVLPATSNVTRYRWQPPDGSLTVGLLDTPGYADADLSARQLDDLFAAFQRADVVLLIMDATRPARDPDLKLLDVMASRFEKEPHVRPPAVLGVLTHMDGLSPLMEWSPPYDWQHPTRPKEHSLHDAVAYNFGVFGDRLQAVVPVCSDVERLKPYGIQEWLIPALCEILDEGRARALVRSLHAEANRERVRELLSQFHNAGRTLIKLFAKSSAKSTKSTSRRD